ncbi:unnamed protein product [Fructobacillus cardui]|uniref:hypothetical protein n=1 Tax=Fructobacillus cardui TaxID=2893170 RepID=UPI002D8DA12C|nr:unnamed protein product [Fructobacillus cardui]CAK1246306.1 unnamed protein product [Fructobacillus cardui]
MNEVTVAMYIDGFEFSRKNYENEHIADRAIDSFNSEMVETGKPYIKWRKVNK